MIHILLVDDDPALFNVTKILLERDGGIKVELCSSVSEAMGLLGKKKYDVIISDYDMPGRDGIEFFTDLREKGFSIPFILFTGKGDENTAIKALNCGIDYYQKKGDDSREVFRNLQGAVVDIASRRMCNPTRESRMEGPGPKFFPDFIVITNPEGQIISADKNLEKLLELPEGSMKSQSLFAFVSPHCREEARRYLASSGFGMPEKESVTRGTFNLDLLMDDGSTIAVEFLAKIISRGGGHPDELLLIGSLPRCERS